MNEVFLSYIVFVVFSLSIVWALKVNLAKINPIVSCIGVSVFIISEIVVFLLFHIEHARDFVLFLQLLVFMYNAFHGELFQKKNVVFSNMTVLQMYFLVGRTLLLGTYIFYVLGSFPDRLSPELKPVGWGLVVVLVFIMQHFDHRKKKDIKCVS